MTTVNKFSLLNKLINRGDQIDIIDGVLTIQPHSQKEVPQEWLKENKNRLASEIAELFPLDVYIYDSYSTGHYGKHKSPGITVQFISITTGQEAYVIFNAELKAKRKSKNRNAGEPLPKGQFTVTKNMLFYKWWESTGLKFPPRLSSFHCYMGNLKQLFFIASPDKQGKITDKLISTLNIKYEDIKELLCPCYTDKPHTVNRQGTDNIHTTTADKKITVAPENKGLQSNSSTGQNKYDIRLYGSPLCQDSCHC